MTKTTSYDSLGSRPPAKKFNATDSVHIANGDYSILSTSDGLTWTSEGKSALLTDRPAATAYGVGTWQVDEKIYLSDGLVWTSKGTVGGIPTLTTPTDFAAAKAAESTFIYGGQLFVEGVGVGIQTVSSLTNIPTGASGVYSVGGFIVSVVNGWLSVDSIFKLIMTGTGSVIIDTKDISGSVITAAFSYPLSGTMEIHSFASETVAAIKLTISSTATVNIG